VKRILYIFVALTIFASLFQSITPQANAALDCNINTPEDGGGDHWSPASTKSTVVWLTINHPKENFPSEVDAYIKWDGNKKNPDKINTVESNYIYKPGVLFLQGVAHQDDDYYTRSEGKLTDHKWRTGNYTVYLTKKGDKVANSICAVSFTIEPYCSIQVNGGSGDWVPDWIPSFKVTTFNPYQESSNHIAILEKDGRGEINRVENSASTMLNTGVSFTKKVEEGTYKILLIRDDDRNARCLSDPIHIKEGGGSLGCMDNSECDDNAICLPDDDGDGAKQCGLLSQYNAGKGFYACTPDDPNNPKSYTCHTALGDISTDSEGFIKTVLALILGLSGGILLIVIILNGYKFMFSQGDPEKIKDAREGIVAAIMGIFLIIFSLTLLTIVTSNVLGIPGFGG